MRAADERDQHDESRDAHMRADQARIGDLHRFVMRQQIADKEKRKRRDYREVAPVSPWDDLARDDEDEDLGKSQIECRKKARGQRFARVRLTNALPHIG